MKKKTQGIKRNASFIDPITGGRQKLSSAYQVDPSRTGQSWIFDFENPHTFEFEVSKKQLAINCAGNCNGVDGVIRILLDGSFSLKKSGQISGQSSQTTLASWFQLGDSGVSEEQSFAFPFLFQSGTELISRLKTTLMIDHGGHELDHSPDKPKRFESNWWIDAFSGRTIL